jgi:hypothetical protein
MSSLAMHLACRCRHSVRFATVCLSGNVGWNTHTKESELYVKLPLPQAMLTLHGGHSTLVEAR